MKKKLLIGMIVLIMLVAFFPYKLMLKDGGTQVYQPLSQIYCVTDYHAIVIDEKGTSGYLEGIGIEVFGIEIYNNTRVNYEGLK